MLLLRCALAQIRFTGKTPKLTGISYFLHEVVSRRGASGVFTGSHTMGFHSKLTALALNRFGLGGRPKDLAFARSDPRGFFADEVKRKLVVQPTVFDLLDTPAALAALREQRQVRR